MAATTWKKIVVENGANTIAQTASGITGTTLGDLAILDTVDSGQIANGSIDTAHIANAQVTYAKMQNTSAAKGLLGNSSGIAGSIVEIAPADVLTMLGVEEGADNNNISDANAGLLTGSANTILHFHDADRARANHTGTQAASTISDFDTEVSNNTAVAANTDKETNVTTNLSITGTDGARTIVSSDGDDAIIPVATDSVSGVMSAADHARLAGMEDGATADQDLSGYQLIVTEGAFVAGDKTKLDNIEDNATADQGAAEITGLLGDVQSFTLGQAGGSITIAGDLVVSGTTITTATETLEVADNTLVLNSDLTGASVDAGFVFERGTSGDNAVLSWDETAGRFGVATSATVALADPSAHLATMVIAGDAVPPSADSWGIGSMHIANDGTLYLRVS